MHALAEAVYGRQLVAQVPVAAFTTVEIWLKLKELSIEERDLSI